MWLSAAFMGGAWVGTLQRMFRPVCGVGQHAGQALFGDVGLSGGEEVRGTVLTEYRYLCHYAAWLEVALFVRWSPRTASSWVGTVFGCCRLSAADRDLGSAALL